MMQALEGIGWGLEHQDPGSNRVIGQFLVVIHLLLTIKKTWKSHFSDTSSGVASGYIEY